MKHSNKKKPVRVSVVFPGLWVPLAVIGIMSVLKVTGLIGLGWMSVIMIPAALYCGAFLMVLFALWVAYHTITSMDFNVGSDHGDQDDDDE